MFKFVIKQNRLKEISDELRKQAVETAYAAASMASTQMKIEMAKPKRGRTYKRGRRGRHVASAPGEAPAVDMGHLINTIQVIRMQDGAAVSVDAESAMPLEFGSAHFAPRPFFGPATKKAGQWYFVELRRLKI